MATTLYHFILTLQLPSRAGSELKTWSATVNVPPGRGRSQVYQDVLADLTKDAPEWARANVLHWSLEMDELRHTGTPTPLDPPAQGPSPTQGHLPRPRG